MSMPKRVCTDENYLAAQKKYYEAIEEKRELIRKHVETCKKHKIARISKKNKVEGFKQIMEAYYKISIKKKNV